MASAVQRKEDPALARCWQQVRAQAEADLSAEPLRRELTHGRLLRVSQEALRRIYTLGVTWRLGGDDRFAEAAEVNLQTICEFENWNYSHALDMAELTHAAAIGFDWLYDRLDEDLRRRVVDCLGSFALEPAAVDLASDKPPKWMSPVLREFNWNLVCNGGLLIGALAARRELGDLADRVIERTTSAMPLALQHFGPDGLWAEGVQYWRYAVRYLAYSLSALATATGSDQPLASAPGLDRTGRFYLHATDPTGTPHAFAAVGEQWVDRGALWELLWVGGRFDDPHCIAAAHDELDRKPAAPEHLIFYRPRPSVEPLATDAQFRGRTPAAYFRSAWADRDATWLAIKGGYNRVNHGHMDLGCFELTAGGVRWAIDLGTESYQVPGYWDRHRDDASRWRYFRCATIGHNTLTLDGRNQLLDGTAVLTDFQSSPPSAQVTLDLTAAYADRAGRVVRTAQLLPGRRAVRVIDVIEPCHPCEVTWTMLTRAEIETDGPTAILRQAGRCLRCTLSGPDGASFVTASAHRDPPESPNDGIRCLRIVLPGVVEGVRLDVRLEIL